MLVISLKVSEIKVATWVDFVSLAKLFSLLEVAFEDLAVPMHQDSFVT